MMEETVDAWPTWLKQQIDLAKAQVATEVLQSICPRQVPLVMAARHLWPVFVVLTTLPDHLIKNATCG